MNNPRTNMSTQNMTKAELFRKIQELSFVKVELELFLDTHPDSRVAMDYYRETVEALKNYLTAYQAEHGPIHAEAGAMGDKWSWVDKPWPWQNEKMTDMGEDLD